MDKLISIVVPVYNAERFLPSTLDSVLAQTYGNFELIIVDDGSTDASRDIIGSYEKKDPRIRFFSADHGGAGNARNVGIGHAEGDFLFFFDADDIMLENCLGTLIDAENEYHTDLVIAGRLPKSVIDKNGNVILKTEDSDNVEIRKPGDRGALDDLSEISPSVDNKLYRSDIVREYGIRFENTNIGDDANFFYKYLSVSDSVLIIDKAVYSYRVAVGSLSHKAGLHILDIGRTINDVETFAEKNCRYPEFLHALGSVAIHHCFVQFRKYVYFTKLSDRKKVFNTVYDAMIGFEKKYSGYLNERTERYLRNVKKKYRYRAVFLSFPYCLYVRKREKGRIGSI